MTMRFCRKHKIEYKTFCPECDKEEYHQRDMAGQIEHEEDYRYE